MKTFSEKLQELINENNLNYSKIEEDLKIGDYTTITRQTISNYCNGRDPELSKLKILAKYFNVSLMYFIDDEIENKTIKNINIGKELCLSDKTINNIKNINKQDIVFENGFKDTINMKNNIKMFNLFMEEFEGLQDFLQDLDILDCHVELYGLLNNLSFINQLDVYLVDLFYTNKNHLNHILLYIEKMADRVIELLQDGTRCLYEYNRDEFQSFKEYLYDLNYRLNQKKMTKNTKYEILIDLGEITEICLETMAELRKEIVFNRYRLSNNINEYIDNYRDFKLSRKLNEYNGIYLSDDKELNKFIIEGKKKQDKYTEFEINKYTILNTEGQNVKR